MMMENLSVICYNLIFKIMVLFVRQHVFLHSQQNSVAKKNHYMLEITRACLIVAHIQSTFFRRCYLACYLSYETFT